MPMKINRNLAQYFSDKDQGISKSKTPVKFAPIKEYPKNKDQEKSPNLSTQSDLDLHIQIEREKKKNKILREKLNLKGNLATLKSLHNKQRDFMQRNEEFQRIKTQYSKKLYELYNEYKNKNKRNLEEMKREVEFDLISKAQEEKQLEQYLKRIQKDIELIVVDYDSFIKQKYKKEIAEKEQEIRLLKKILSEIN